MSTIPSISTKWTITSHLISLNIKKTTRYDVGNPGTSLGQTQKGDGVKPVNRVPTLPIFLFLPFFFFYKFSSNSVNDLPSVSFVLTSANTPPGRCLVISSKPENPSFINTCKQNHIQCIIITVNSCYHELK